MIPAGINASETKKNRLSPLIAVQSHVCCVCEMDRKGKEQDRAGPAAPLTWEDKVFNPLELLAEMLLTC